MTTGDRILVVKLSALGDFVQALGSFAAIRRHHADAHITLLTTAPFHDLARASGYFDRVLIDNRPKPVDFSGWLRLRRTLRSGRFRRVYDLQTSDRSSLYFRLFWPGPRPEWSGIAPGCSHPHDNPLRESMHTIERQAEQLRIAGIADMPPPDLSWVQADISGFGLADRYVLLVPGGAAHRPEKRWPAERFADLAARLDRQGLQPVLIGGPAEAELTARIAASALGARDLAGQTSHLDIAALARAAVGAVGNDTGPMHLIAVTGCRSAVLYSHASDPALCRQRGPAVQIIRRANLDQLSVEDVEAALHPLT